MIDKKELKKAIQNWEDQLGILDIRKRSENIAVDKRLSQSMKVNDCYVKIRKILGVEQGETLDPKIIKIWKQLL